MRLARIIRESAVEAFFVACSKALGWVAAKFVSPNWNGVPDRMVLKGLREALVHFKLWGGYTDDAQAERDLRELLAMCIEFVELKALGRKPTILQLRRHEQLTKLGFKVSVVDSRESAEQWYADRT